MKKGFWGFTALGFMLTAMLLAAVPAWAQSVDDKIKALEQELGQLKSQQMELKKESTAAGSRVAELQLSSGQRCEHRSGGQVMGHPLRRWRLTSARCLRAGKTQSAGPTVR